MSKHALALATVVLILALLPISTAHAANPGMSYPWIGEIIDTQDDIDVLDDIDITRVPGLDILFVSYAGTHDVYGYRILRAAFQVPPGTGNCGLYYDWQCDDVDNSKGVGLFNSIAAQQLLDANGNPYWVIGIAYFDQNNASLKYASRSITARDGSGSGWFATTVHRSDSTLQFAGQSTDLLFDPSSGQPVIAYRSGMLTHLSNPKYYVNTATYVGPHAGNCGPDVNKGWQCDMIDSGNPFDFGKHVAIGLIGSTFHYFYTDSDAQTLNYAYRFRHSVLSTCATKEFWCGVVDGPAPGLGRELRSASWSGNTPGSDAYNPSMAASGVYLAYRDTTNQTIKIAYSVPETVNGDCGDGTFSCFVLESVGTGAYKSVAIGMDPNHWPVVAYAKPSPNYDEDLWIARPVAATLAPRGYCDGNNADWSCGMLLMADDNFYVGGHAAVDVSQDNLINVAFNLYYPMSDYNDLALLGQDPYRVDLPIVLTH